MLGLTAALQLRPFLDGWLLTADDTFFQYWAYTRPLPDWLTMAWDIAVWKAKLGEAFSIPVMILGNAGIESVVMRAANLAVFAVSFALFALWLGRRVGAAAALGLALLAVALTPLRFFHMPPTSYPLFPTLQIALLMVCLLGLRGGGRQGGAWATLAAAGLTLAMLSSEYVLLFGAALIVVEAAAGDRRPRALAADRRLRALAVAGLVHVAFRQFAGEDTYTAISGADAPGRLAAVVVNHTLNGLALGPAAPPLDWGALSPAELGRAALVAGGAGLATMLAAPWLRQGPLQALPLLAVAVVLALAMTVPIGLMEKYRAWCVRPAVCAYVDSRFAGWAAMAALALPLHAALRRLPAILPAACLAALAGLTALQNGAVAAEMRAYRAPWHAAEWSLCAGEAAWRAFLESELAASVPFHAADGRTRSDYWRAWGTRAACPDG